MGSEESLNSKVDAFFEEHRDLHVGWLRSLHSLAERAFQEEETSNFIYSVLKEHCSSLKVTRGLNDLPTAILAVHTPHDATQPAILLRADMDGLPVRGTDGTPSPLHPDVHHACGHDGHITCLLACAHWLHNFGGLPHRKLVLFFQPAEEAGSGARVAVESGGLLDTLHSDVEAVYALHSWPEIAVGDFAVGAGPMMGMSGGFKVEISGQGGHAAKPSEASGDALLAACALVVCAQAVVARGTNPFAPAVAAFTRVENVGCNAINAIPAYVRVSGTIRALDETTFDSVRRQICRHAEGAAAMHGCKVSVQFKTGYAATRNSESGARVAQAAALQVVGGDAEHVHQVGFADGMMRPTLCAEDFSVLLRKRGGAYVWLGNGAGGPRLHESGFRFDERALVFGGKLFVHLAMSRGSGGDVARRGEF